jgi:hypothetical protein
MVILGNKLRSVSPEVIVKSASTFRAVLLAKRLLHLQDHTIPVLEALLNQSLNLTQVDADQCLNISLSL